MYNEKKFRAIYDEFLDSGLTIRDFCANQHMNVSIR
jgi:glutathione peroxidase-family protein